MSWPAVAAQQRRMENRDLSFDLRQRKGRFERDSVPTVQFQWVAYNEGTR